MDKSGFYKETVDGWYFAPNCVSSPTYELLRELKDTYIYPIDGWFWSDIEPINYVDIFMNNENNNLI